MTCFVYYAKAQVWENYGSGVDGNVTTDSFPFKRIYTDHNRARVTKIANIPHNGKMVSRISLGTRFGSFSPNRKVMVIDLGAPCGSRNYDLMKVEIVCIGCGTQGGSLLYYLQFSDTLKHIFNNTMTDKVQVIQIPESENLHV
mgnify:CR=1 FL=1